jgi:hypothetical protein
MLIISPRRVLTFVALLLFLLVAGHSPAAQTSGSTITKDPLEPVRARFASDSRLVVFDLTVERRPGGVAVKGEVESASARDAAIEALRASGETTVVDQITVLPDAALGDRTRGLVRVSVANVRGKPAHAAELVTQTLMGWPVRLLKQQSGWYLVHVEPEGYLGWIEELQLTRVTAEDEQGWESRPRVIVLDPYAVLRAGPAADADPVADLVSGSLLRLGASAGAWTEVRLPDERRGFVRASEVQDYAVWTASRTATPEGIERTARQFMGVPYLWGGTSAKGFDCSGFVKTVFRLHGIELPRDTDQQALVGAAVTLDPQYTELRKGDLLFFGTPATSDGPERASHVAIYVGNLEVIHASGLVRRNSLDPASPIYAERLRTQLLRVRRVLPGRVPSSSGAEPSYSSGRMSAER